jgi:glycosyltransferase involved in cell wall biosynthesis
VESSVSGRQALTAGYLPVAAFRHLDPTLVGRIELDEPLRFQLADPGRAAAGERDALALVRLHGEPLGVVHLDGAALEDEDALAAVIWAELADAIAAHSAQYGCIGEPITRDALTGRGLGGAPCPGAVAALPAGSVSMIVPTGGRADKLPRCLRSLAALDHPDVELMVVDNRPDDPSTKAAVDALVAEGLEIRYVAERRPGSSVARNRGMVESSAEFVAFTDDDVVVDPGFLRWLLAPFVTPVVNAVTGMVLPLELETPAQKRFEQYAGFSKGVRRAQYDLGAHRADDRVMYPYWGGVFGSGNSMAFRRAELVAAGGLDPTLGAGSRALAGSDIEAFSAAILRGGRLVYEPRSLCWHEHRRDDAALERQIFNYGVGLSAIFTKALLHDTRRFVASFARSVPIALRLRRERRTLPPAAQEAQLPAELSKLNTRGLLRGPKLYVTSVRWARRLRLGDVITGR